MAGQQAGRMSVDERRRGEVFRAADQIRAEGKERVALRTVWARVKRNAGVAGSNQVVGEHLSAWYAERGYNPAIELAAIPDVVSARLVKAGVEMWAAAQAEAAAVLERERLRMADVVATERDLRSEALGMVDAQDAVIEALRAEIARYSSELEAARKHMGAVRAREFWRRVIREIWEILPESGALHVNEITLRIGADLVQESSEHKQVWDVDTVRGAIDERMYRKRLFVSEGGGHYRRRRPEDDGVSG